MGFHNTVHERNIHAGTVDGTDALVCHQVDDFAVGAESPDTAQLFIAKIREHVQAKCAATSASTSKLNMLLWVLKPKVVSTNDTMVLTSSKLEITSS